MVLKYCTLLVYTDWLVYRALSVVDSKKVEFMQSVEFEDDISDLVSICDGKWEIWESNSTDMRDKNLVIDSIVRKNFIQLVPSAQ